MGRQCNFCLAKNSETDVNVLKLSDPMIASLGRGYQGRDIFICLGHWQSPPVTRGPGPAGRVRWTPDATLPQVVLAQARADQDEEMDSEEYESDLEEPEGHEGDKVKNIDVREDDLSSGEESFEDSQEPEDFDDVDWENSQETSETADSEEPSQSQG
jgi:hypothetical protein